MVAGADTALDLLDSATCVDVTELEPRQWEIVRDMRIAALDDAPGAFVSTAETEEDQLTEYWQDQFDWATWVIARDHEQVVGIAALALPDGESPPDSRYVESVWVAPTHRRHGVLRQMLEHLERLAKSAGATELRLWVLDTNGSAGRAYERLDFRPIPGSEADTKKLRGDGTSFVQESLMTKELLL
ncbi:MAG: GNAT family N-acetyltransferase [Pseudonocardia sp.]